MGTLDVPLAALELIRRFEGLRLSAYLDGSGVRTIGWGHTGDVDPGQTISPAQAEVFLYQDASKAAAAVGELVTVALMDNQRAALIDFVYNLGAPALGGSSLLRLVNREQFDLAADEFGRWVHDEEGHVEPGLVARREAERALFATVPA
jgi:lysozyme